MTEKSRSGAMPAEEEFVITRVLAAPRALVFKAWTQPEHFVRWWGPKGFSTPFCTIDLRPGGALHFCMRSPEGQDYWCKGIFRDIVPPERLVFTDFFSDELGNQVPPAQYGMDPDWPLEALVTVTFVERDGKTTMTIRQSVPTKLAERVGARQGWGESLDRLEAYLRQPTKA